MIDTHAHIYLEDLKSDLPEIISRAKKAGVENILMPNIDVSTIPDLENVALDYKGYCIPMMGLHPCQ